MITFKKIFVALLVQFFIIPLSYSADASKPISKTNQLPTSSLTSQFANVNGIRLHYLEKGKGPLVILLHGWPETSLAWRNTINALSVHYRVVAPDLRGIGLSERTPTGYDKKTIATDIKALVDYLGGKQAIIIGHDMGGKPAYVMAHLYPESVAKLVLVDCLVSGTENTDPAHGGRWYWGFNMQPSFPEMHNFPEKLIQGHEKEYMRAVIKALSFKKDAISEQTIDEYVKSYSTPAGMTAGFNYFRTLKEDAALVKTFEGEKLLMPVLVITASAEHNGVGEMLANTLKKEAPSLQVIIAKDSGHFIPEEDPKFFNSEVLTFLDNTGANTDQSNVIAVVKKAENYIKKYGKEKAIIEFKKNSAQIFMGDYNGNFYLSPLHPELIGANQFNYKDASGALPVQEEIEKAKAGGGWLKGRWRKNPQTEKYQCRKIYILPMPGNYFIGSWYNYSPDSQGTCSI